MKGEALLLHLHVQRSVALLIRHRPPDGKPYYGGFSGGKDSVVIKELCRLAEVPVIWNYNVTTIDPPELVRFIKKYHADVAWLRSKWGNFFNRMEQKGLPPTRSIPWCCAEFKEQRCGEKSDIVIFGVRVAESPKRASTWTDCRIHYERTKQDRLAPIRLWTDAHVWQFIHERNLPYCELYDQGFKRLGCIGCPKSGDARIAEFARWPGFGRRWRLAFDRMWARHAGRITRRKAEWFGSARFKGPQEMWESWMLRSPFSNLTYDRKKKGK